MTIPQRIAALKVKLAEKHEAGVFKENPNGFTCAPYCNGDFLSMAFEAGAEALVEIYRLEGKIAAMDQFYEVGGIGGAAHSLSIAYKLELEAALGALEQE